MPTFEDTAGIARNFALPGPLTEGVRWTGGHIHDSYRLTCAHKAAHGAEFEPYLLQRINTTIFRDPLRVMANIERVTTHIRRQLAEARVPDVDRRVLTVVPTVTGHAAYEHGDGSWWRIYRFIAGSYALESVTTPALAALAGRAFGEFQRLLATLPPPRLHETLPGFHDTPARFVALRAAVADDVCGRAAQVRAELDFARAHEESADAVLQLHRRGKIPERVVHNDAKLSNVLLDEATGQPLCIVDLDIVMPGLAPFDLGDMVRSMTCPAAEDEPDLSKVEVRAELYEALVRGYFAGAGDSLNPFECETHCIAGWTITLEQGVRFLTDYLRGDTYYRTTRPRQNLDRARVQFKLVESLERQQGELEQMLLGAWSKRRP